MATIDEHALKMVHEGRYEKMVAKMNTTDIVPSTMLTVEKDAQGRKISEQKRHYMTNLCVPGDVDKIQSDQESGNNEYDPWNGLILVPTEIFAQPEQRMHVLVLTPILI